MASTKRISSFIVDQLYVVARRGFSTGSQASVSSSVRGSGVGMMKKSGEEPKKSAWVPDPVTGYYKPEGQINQVESPEPRQLRLKQKNRQY